jgi:hypothetical protein
LNALAKDDFNILTKIKVGKQNYYVNNGLMDVIANYDYQL